MFNELIIREGSVRNTAGADGAVEGFSFETHIAYYRGLAPGEHEITVNQRLRVSYMPILTENRFTRKVEVDR